MIYENIFNISGKRILITGAGKGIGLEIAKFLASYGAIITIISRNIIELQSAVETIRLEGGMADYIPLDVADIQAIDASSLGEITFDVLINNAGTNRPKPLIEVDETDYDNVMNVNIKGMFFITKCLVKNMIRNGINGSIINISSQMGHVGAANRTIYCASKHAVEGFTKSLAAELGKHNIRVNSLAPTFIETPMTTGFLQDESFRQDVMSKIKLGRLAQEKDLFGAVLLLASDASSMMTGSAIKIDGGWTTG